MLMSVVFSIMNLVGFQSNSNLYNQMNYLIYRMCLVFESVARVLSLCLRHIRSQATFKCILLRRLFMMADLRWRLVCGAT